MSRDYFQSIADALVGFLRPEYRKFQSRVSGRNVKIWYGDVHVEHYEVQFLRGDKLEVGFHVEYSDGKFSDQTLGRVLKAEPKWRKLLGDEPETGAFLGQKKGPWRRVSEVWDGEVSDPDCAIEAADRLAEYIHTIEPIRLGVFAPTPKAKPKAKR